MNRNIKPVMVGGVGEKNFGKQYRQGNRIYSADAIAVALNASPVGNAGGYSYLYAVGGGETVNSDIQPLKVGNLYPSGGQAGNVYDANYCAPCLPGFGAGGGGKELKIMEVHDMNEDQMYVDNISEKFAFAKQRTQEMLDRDGSLPDMFNPYNKAEITDIAPTQTTCCNSASSSAAVMIKQPQLRIRKLTPKECFRLMGFDDADHDVLVENGISNSQIYKMAGNSIVVDVLEAIFTNLNEQYNLSAGV
ncbi:MAG: DNA cytosine methyltransferase [Peptococcaceae bacterium]|nr:DNA cytosine methyltransferase [Peptococcaceae bacterium]